MNDLSLREIVWRALQEDIGTGDVSASLIPDNIEAKAHIVSKSKGVIAGLILVKLTFKILDERISFVPELQDGQRGEKGDIIASVEGQARSILMGERVALNFLQRLSGIATMTATFVEAVKGYPVRIVDTRKTTPNLRLLEKYAVRVGGGHNHRFGLYDAVMIKDNHIVALGSISEAVRKAREAIPHTMKVEVEVTNLEQVREALRARADIIMLDNMSPEDMKEAVQIIDGEALVEASGNITLDNIRKIAQTGVDVISSGAITHSAGILDMSLDFEEKK